MPEIPLGGLGGTYRVEFNWKPAVLLSGEAVYGMLAAIAIAAGDDGLEEQALLAMNDVVSNRPFHTAFICAPNLRISGPV